LTKANLQTNLSRNFWLIKFPKLPEKSRRNLGAFAGFSVEIQFLWKQANLRPP